MRAGFGRFATQPLSGLFGPVLAVACIGLKLFEIKGLALGIVRAV